MAESIRSFDYIPYPGTPYIRYGTDYLYTMFLTRNISRKKTSENLSPKPNNKTTEGERLSADRLAAVSPKMTGASSIVPG